MPRPRADEALVDEALRLVGEGKTPAAAAEALGGRISKTTIYDALKARKSSQTDLGDAPQRLDEGGEEADLGELAELGANPDDLAVIDKLVTLTLGRIEKAEPVRFNGLVATLANLVARRAKLRPPPAKTQAELDEEAKPTAERVLDNIERPIREAHE